MDQRHRFRVFIFFLLQISSTSMLSRANADKISEDQTEVVTATPVDVFSDRAGPWHSYTESSGKILSETNTVYDSLGRIPGVQSRNEGSPTISIRGSQSMPRVLGLYNGVPLNGPDGLGVNKQLIPNERIDEIKLLKGPASVFWGGDAMAGAVNFITYRRERASVRGHLGSFGQRGIFGVAPILSSQKSYLDISAFQENYDGNYSYILPSSGASGTRSANNHSLQRYTARGEQESGRFKFFENLIWAQEIGTSPGSIPFPSHDDARYSSAMGSLETQYHVSNDLDITHRIHSVRLDGDFKNYTAGDSYSKASKIGNALSIKKSFASALSAEALVDHNHEEFRSTYSGDRVFIADQPEAGVILDIPYEQDFVIRPGTRYIFAENQFISALGIFEENKSLSRWITYSEGFHSPSLSQKYGNYFSSTFSSIGNPNLKSESSQQWEIGFIQKFIPSPEKYWQQFYTGVTVYTMSYRNFISSQFLPGNISQPINSGSASSQGVEGSAGYTTDIWHVDGAYSYLSTSDQNRQSLPLSPENQASLTFGYRWAILHMQLIDTYWGRYFDRGSAGLTELSSWNTLDFTVSTNDLNEWKIFAGIFNIFDVSREFTVGYPEAGRRLQMSVERFF